MCSHRFINACGTYAQALLSVCVLCCCSLNALGFEWELTDQEAKWHHLYHQLRRYRTLYGTTDIDTTHSSLDGCDWRIVAR